MKKLLLVLVLLFTVSTFTSCTDSTDDELELFSPDPDDDGTIEEDQQETGGEGGN